MTGAAETSQISADYEALLQFLYLAPVGLAQASLDGAIGMINPVSAQLLMPLSRDGDLTNLFTALEPVAPDLRHLCAAFTPAAGIVCDGMRLYLGASRQVLSLSIVKLDPERLMAVLADVTEQVRREHELRQNDAWLNAILTGITDYALIGLDRQGRVAGWNESIGRLTGFSQEATVGQPYAMFNPVGASTPDRCEDLLHEADQSGWSLAEGPRQRADGSQFWGSSIISPLHDRPLPGACDGDDAGPAYCLIIRDISERRRAGAASRHAALSDHLTGLANRRAFFEDAERELGYWAQRPRPTTLVMIDADHFKAINDRFGHPAGDAVLRHLSGALRGTFRHVDVIARVGGEEFAVLLPSTDLASAAAAAGRLLLLVQQDPVMVDGEAIRYTVSAGVATMDNTTTGLEGLIKRADQALYLAKARGRDQVACWSAEAGADKPVIAIRTDAH